tara:strand:+ start:279 stop:617 length:339 start_codon:yes stop_codon:yes gene_type:complete
MKLTQRDLKQLILEALSESQSVLLEFPGGMAKPRMGPNAVAHEEDDGDSPNEGSMSRQELFHMAEKANQLHALITDKEDLDPWVQAKITKAAAMVGSVFDHLTYKKKNPEGR